MNFGNVFAEYVDFFFTKTWEYCTEFLLRQINSTEEFDFWNGSLLKITIACEGNQGMTGNEERCVLFKVETLPRYNEIVIPVARVAIRKDNDNKLMDSEIGNRLISKGRDNTQATVVRRRESTKPFIRQFFRRRSTRRRSTGRRSTRRRPTTPPPTRRRPTRRRPTTPPPTTPPPTTPPPTTPPPTTSPPTTSPPTTSPPTTPPPTTSPPTTPPPTTPPPTTSPPTTPSTTRPPTTRPVITRSTKRPRVPTSAVRTTQSRSHESTEGEKMSSKHLSQSPTPMTSTTENSQKGKKDETSKSAGKNSTAIAVTVTLLVVALALALGYLVYYRRRKRAQVPQNNYNDLGVVNHSMEIYEDPDWTYETLKEDRNEVFPNQPGTSSDTYSYPDSNIIPNPTSSEQEYTYAKDTDFPKSSVSTKATSEKPISNGAVYQTLEQPGQPTVDNFYNYLDNTNITKPPVSSELEYTYAKDTGLPRRNPNTKVATQDPANGAVYHTLEQPGQPNDDDFYYYPDNTNITKPPSSELEYTYAKDTDFPRVTADKKAAPEDPTSNAVYHTLEHEPPTTDLYKSPGAKIPTELEYTYAKDTEIPKSFVNTKTVPKGNSAPAASDALYHTPGKEEPAPIEPEYSYAKNTDIPSIPLGTEQTTNGHSSPPPNSALHHTLEEPNPPQAPVYSTLEKPEDVENHKQVKDEVLNFSDHTYIDVNEDSTDSRNPDNPFVV